MMEVLGILVFTGAFATASAVIVGSVVPQWNRIVGLASGRTEQSFAPLTGLVRAERRIAVRRWSATSRPGPLQAFRAAA